MKYLKQFLLAGLMLNLLLPCMAQNRKIDLKENLPFEQVLKMAKEQNKLIFLDFGDLTCAPCMYLKRFIFTIDSVADFVNERFVSVDYFERNGGERKKLSERYGVDSEPVLLILDQQGNFMHRMVGKCTSDELIERFKLGLDTANNLAAQNRKYESGNRDPEFLLAYLDNLLIAKHTAKMNLVAKEVLAGPLEQLKEKRFWDIFYKYDEDPVSRQMLYVFDNREEFGKLYGKNIVESKINKLFSAKSSYYIFGHSAPIKDSSFKKMLTYLQSTDYDKATEWLTYMVPAQYKFTDWVAMAEAIDDVLRFNILKGSRRELYMKMMAEQLCWYSDDKKALGYAVKWIDSLQSFTRNDDYIKSSTETKQRILRKISGNAAR